MEQILGNDDSLAKINESWHPGLSWIHTTLPIRHILIRRMLKHTSALQHASWVHIPVLYSRVQPWETAAAAVTSCSPSQ